MNKLKLIYLVSFLEGSALMAAEIISAKIMAPYYGNSLIVWTSVFVCTLSGLALGYFWGAKLSQKENIGKKLNLILGFSVIYFAIMSPLSEFIMSNTLSLSIEIGSLISVLTFLFPLLLAFGMVSPLIIQLIASGLSDTGEKAGTIYTVSTLGGILTTLLFGFYFIPQLGLKMSIIISTVIILIAFAISFVLYRKKIIL